jgi:hypothetical protein
VDLREVVAVFLGLLQAGLEGVDDGAVALQGEDQGHVDADALGQGGGDCFEAFEGGRDLDQDVVLVDPLVQVLGLGNGACRVPGQAGVNLDGHAAIHAVGCCCDGCEQVAGIGDVGGGDFEDGVLDAGAGCCLLCDRGIVVGA